MTHNELKELFKKTLHIFQVTSEHALRDFAILAKKSKEDFEKEYSLFQDVESNHYFVISKKHCAWVSAVLAGEKAIWSRHTEEDLERFVKGLKLRIYKEEKQISEMNKRSL